MAFLEQLLVYLFQQEGPVVLELINGLIGKLAHQNGVALAPTPAHTAPPTNPS